MRSFAGGDGDGRQVMLGADFSALLPKGADANFRSGRLRKTRKTMRPAFAREMPPVSSETTTAIASEISVIPIAAR